MHRIGPANRIAELRATHGLSQARVAELIGKDRSVVTRYERGEVQIPDSVKLELAVLFGVTRAYLMNWDGDGTTDATDATDATNDGGGVGEGEVAA